MKRRTVPKPKPKPRPGSRLTAPPRETAAAAGDCEVTFKNSTDPNNTDLIIVPWNGAFSDFTLVLT